MTFFNLWWLRIGSGSELLTQIQQINSDQNTRSKRYPVPSKVLAGTWYFKHDIQEQPLHDGPQPPGSCPLLDGQPGDGLQRLSGELQLNLINK